MCAHTMAELPDFRACFKKAKKVLSLSQFAEATMPKGKERKGSRCPRKRKASVPTTAVLENPAYLRVPVTTQLSTSMCQLQCL